MNPLSSRIRKLRRNINRACRMIVRDMGLAHTGLQLVARLSRSWNPRDSHITSSRRVLE